MAIVNDYQSGTVSVANGATAVTGVGTAWAAADIRPGDMFMRDGYGVVIADVTDNTHLTLAENWPGVTLAGSAYRIRFQPDGARYTAAARPLVERQVNGDGRSALHSKKSLTSGDWSAPAYLTRPVGPLAPIAVGATTTLAPAPKSPIPAPPQRPSWTSASRLGWGSISGAPMLGARPI